MIEITQEFLEARAFLFREIPKHKEEWDIPIVCCRQHQRFVPCRRCLYSEVATVPYSSKEEDIKIVKEHQCRSGC